MTATDDRSADLLSGQLNPYQSPSAGGLVVVPYFPGTTPQVTLIRKSFLYRELSFEAPLVGVLSYNAFQLADELRWDRAVICRRYPWLWLYESLSATLVTDHGPVELEVRIRFGSFARIREFVVLLQGIEVYRE